ncbi:NAD-dependent epimerase/dehydratase [Pseudozyma hubeiensis SY62]|uniref:NAD-dependent epimerase/dehydratase n=1 Tax=Pseudozyma hubeiensis (strain SY62) TaxID=1305764 RepID=R9P5I2_PSEHS|nr:NAD-dependent epimerase/dehydratase [Pseudozyma hubeiensis SY62]GAC93330.1 NAD-dependent epimerase/dehydratase [Pseudozyma hubeiensis SY62]
MSYSGERAMRLSLDRVITLFLEPEARSHPTRITSATPFPLEPCTESNELQATGSIVRFRLLTCDFQISKSPKAAQDRNVGPRRRRIMMESGVMHATVGRCILCGDRKTYPDA